MKVTDEMVEAFASVYHFRGQTYTPDLVRAAIEAALSHAAGQEAEKEGDRLNFRRQMADAEHYQREFAATTRRIIDEQNAAPAQEPINPTEIDRKLVGGEAVAWLCVSADGSAIDAVASKHARDTYKQLGRTITPLTPAQPPASAEVGRDAARYRAQFGEDGTWDYSDLWCGETKEAVDAMLDRGIASSGRKGENGNG